LFADDAGYKYMYSVTYLLVYCVMTSLRRLITTCMIYHSVSLIKVEGQTLDIAPQVDIATTKALRYMAHTKQRRTYLPYTFPAVAGTHLPTPRRWRVE